MVTIYHGRRMSVVAGLAAAFLSVAAAQSRPKSEQRKFVSGTVASVWENHVYVNNEVSVIAVAVDARTEIWKGKVFHDLIRAEPGDRIFATCHLDALGNLVAESVELNHFHSSAVITSVSDPGFSIFTNPRADPQSAYSRKESKVVEVDSDTFFEDSAREDLEPGRGVDVTGLDLGNGKVRATRVTIYEGNHAVRFKGGRIVMSNGQIRTILPNGQVVGPVLGQMR